MTDIIQLNVTEMESTVDVTLDWTKLTWRDLLDFNKAQVSASDDEKQQLVSNLVSKLAGVDALDLPALVALQLANLVVERITGDTSPNA